ncbi:MAG: hypothetical protein II957_07400, partial [Treponema sp.]|nr:hypothetical protein [Treponema sp.]
RHRLRLKLRCENHPSLTLIAASRQLAGFHGGVGFLGKLVPQPAALGKKEKIALTEKEEYNRRKQDTGLF